MADQRPTVATVFGVLNCIAGGVWVVISVIALITAIGLLIAASSVAGSLGTTTAAPGGSGIASLITTILGLALDGLLLFAGISLLMNKANALKFNMYYVFGKIALVVINIIISTIAAGLIGAIFASIWGLLWGVGYSLLLYFLVVKNDQCIAFYK